MNSYPSLKLFFASPIALLGLMLLASIANGVKQLLVIRQTGSPMSLGAYLGYIPETMAVLIGNLLAFVVLISIDQLNVASALGIGYGVNSIADLLPGKRSYILKSTADDPDKMLSK